jgi:hypothetical protein
MIIAVSRWQDARDAQNFQKCMSHFKILGARKITKSKFHTDDAHTVGATIQNLGTLLYAML